MIITLLFLTTNYVIIKTVATTVGTVLAYYLVPMKSLGSDNWKIAAALMGRHIGGGNEIINLNHIFVTI